jgi:hypothetical protein
MTLEYQISPSFGRTTKGGRRQSDDFGVDALSKSSVYIHLVADCHLKVLDVFSTCSGKEFAFLQFYPFAWSTSYQRRLWASPADLQTSDWRRLGAL